MGRQILKRGERQAENNQRSYMYVCIIHGHRYRVVKAWGRVWVSQRGLMGGKRGDMCNTFNNKGSKTKEKENDQCSGFH